MHVEPLISLSWTLVMVALTFVVLLIILKKFFFGKVRAFMQAREQKIKDAFDNAEAAGIVAQERLSEYDAKLSGIESERRDILHKTKEEADERAKAILKEAELEAQALRLSTEKALALEKAKAITDMRDQVAMLAIYAAEKIIERDLNLEDHYDIIDAVIKEAEEGAWKP